MPPFKLQPDYWRQRLFRNTFTYRGEQRKVAHWSVKIQHAGKRRTFSLTSAEPAEAAAEASQIYRGLVRQEVGIPTIAGARPDGSTADEKHEPGYWLQRLVHREYTMKPGAAGNHELTVRIEFDGSSHYFPLGTDNPQMAADRAVSIYREIKREGWEQANKRFQRELTLGFRWNNQPLAWTYTTIHTKLARPRDPVAAKAPAGKTSLALIERDSSIRQALAWCVRRMDAFYCAASFSGMAPALAELRQNPVQLVLVNQNLTEQAGPDCLQELERDSKLISVRYACYEDSDELFCKTPGGAGTYVLKRTSPTEFLEPLVRWFDTGSSGDELTSFIWQYFRSACAAPASGNGKRSVTLTQREHAVLAHLGKGFPDKEIADRLQISVYTVHGHLRNIFEKLGVHNRTEAVVKFFHK